MLLRNPANTLHNEQTIKAENLTYNSTDRGKNGMQKRREVKKEVGRGAAKGKSERYICKDLGDSMWMKGNQGKK